MQCVYQKIDTKICFNSAIRTNLGVNLLVDALHEGVPQSAFLELLVLVLHPWLDTFKPTTDRLAADLSVCTVNRLGTEITRSTFIGTLGCSSGVLPFLPLHLILGIGQRRAHGLVSEQRLLALLKYLRD